MSVSRICPNCYRKEGIRVNFGNNHSAEKEFHQQHWCSCGYSSPEEMMKDQDLGFSDAKWVLIIKDFLNTYYDIISTTVIPNKDEHIRLFLKLLKNKINWYDLSVELIPKKLNLDEYEYVRNGKPKKQPKLNIFDNEGLEDIPTQIVLQKLNYNLFAENQRKDAELEKYRGIREKKNKIIAVLIAIIIITVIIGIIF